MRAAFFASFSILSYNDPMTSTAHMLVAGAIASRFPDLPLSSGLALFSHYVMDSIPHWDFGTNWRERPKYMTGVIALVDTFLGFGISYVVFGQFLPFELWITTVIASVLPDWLETPWYIFYANQKKHAPSKTATIVEKIAYAFYKLPNVFHSKTQFPLGVFTQIATVLFFMILLQ